jgi:hypothetical protein
LTIKFYKMQKLQSFDEFAQLGLSGQAMAQLRGGNAGAASTLEGATTTEGGTLCISTSLSASGCWAYSSDNRDAEGNVTRTATNAGPISASDVNVPC